MFPVACPKTAMRDVIFIFHFINRKTTMRNLFIKRNGGNTHKNNAIGRDLSFLIFVMQKCQKLTRIFDLTLKHN